jgi:hypothetical protein
MDPDSHKFGFTNTNTNTNNLFPPIPSDTVMFIYDKYDNKYYNTISCSCLLRKMIDLFTMSLWIRISCSHFLLGLCNLIASNPASSDKKQGQQVTRANICPFEPVYIDNAYVTLNKLISLLQASGSATESGPLRNVGLGYVMNKSGCTIL